MIFRSSRAGRAAAIGRLMAALMLFVGVTVVALASPAQARKPEPEPLATCTLAMDSPHVSSGAGGVIAKLRYCDEDGGRVEVDLYLFLCPNKPSSNEANWKNEGCVVKSWKYYEWTASPFSSYTRYVPPSGTPGAHGTGWWVACAAFVLPGVFTVPSAPVYIAA